jgi:acyl carrier protein
MEEFLVKIQQAFHEAFDVDPLSVSMDTVPDNIPGWDSVGHLALASSLERIFGLSFNVDDLMEMENVREIVRVLRSKLGGV